MELYIYTDESIQKGKYFSNFYGGALVRAKYFQEVNESIKNKRQELNLGGEIKWSKVTSHYLDKYKNIMTHFFRYIQKNKVKIRIMFRQNCYVPTNLTEQQQKNQFFLLYYQFVKHAFCIQDCGIKDEPINIRFYFDNLPNKKEKNNEFKNFVYRLQFRDIFDELDVRIKRENITEVNSKNHNILQCMDVILGSIQFRLNNKHKHTPPDKKRRGKRTIAKEKLYKHINKLIRNIYPNFNIGISTGTPPDKSRWEQPYRHWKFIPSEYRYDDSKTKNN